MNIIDKNRVRNYFIFKKIKKIMKKQQHAHDKYRPCLMIEKEICVG